MPGGRVAAERQQQVAAEARRLPKGTLPAGARALVAVSMALWLAALVYGAVALPDRVPVHWSSGSGADRWSDKVGALAPMVILGLAIMLLPLISRLVVAWPDGLSLRDKEWWTAQPHRLVELERRLRSDLWVLASGLLTMLATVVVVFKIGSDSTDGHLAPGVVLLVPSPALLALGWMVYRAFTAYRPDPAFE